MSENFFYKKLTNYDWFNKSKIIASFLSIKSEISTNDLNQYLLSLGKILCLPVIENKEEILVFKRYCFGDELKKGKFGVREPVNSQTYLPDIIFVPCLAFDENGFRLGYGGGYYDKSIANFYSIKHKFISIGLAYEEQKVNNARLLNNGDTLRVENEMLRNNVRELQEQLQNAYVRIKELTEPKQMELDV